MKSAAKRNRIKRQIREAYRLNKSSLLETAAKKELDDNIPFAQVVEKYSQCPSKKSGGDLGWMPEENLEGLFGSAVG